MIIARRYTVEREASGKAFRVRNLDAPIVPAVVTDEPPLIIAATQPQETPKIAEAVIPPRSISIPSFERITAQGLTLHAANVSNPVRNTCYFVVSLILLDGIEVYRSGYIAPGRSLGDVVMSKPVTAGT
ncbi:hypothetical protein AGMMS49975_23790 [Clostridia bacterium]|nr:hypothetical protein AGMMS49975_23790 [Clostridia bacterium]